MKADTLRKYLVVHTWTGILSSLFLFIAFYAGGLSMFEPEITRWADAGPARTGASQDADALAAAFFASQPKPPRSATLALPTEANAAPYLRYERDGQTHRVELDGDGALRPLPGQAHGAGDFVDHLHRKGGLPLPLDIAEPVIGLISLVYAVALISGVVVLLPSLVKDLFVLRIGRNVKRMWLDLHNLLGVASLPFHIVMALTAAVFGLHDWIYAVQDKLIYPRGMSAVAAGAVPARAPAPLDTAAWLPPSQLVERVRQAAPGFEPVELTYAGLGTPKASVRIGGTDDRHFKRGPRFGYAIVDPAHGHIFETTYLPGRQTSSWGALLVSFFSLHFGSYGGDPLRVLYAVLAMLGALLFYTGNVLWIESRSKRLRQADAPLEQPRHVRWVASLNIGVCLGCIAGLSVAITASRWLAASADLDLVTHAAYYLVFVACVVFAFARGATCSAVGLLAAAAIATALIPATSLLAWIAPTGLAWIAQPYVSGFLFVDLLSAAGAALLACLALRAHWRLRTEPRAATPTPLLFPTPASSTHHE